ncbi:MAG: hypothetical protein ACRDF4_06515, partial [Rhabdochlamydiaceae bacterium]
MLSIDLSHLVDKAPDLKKVLTIERVEQFQAQGAGLILSYATEKISIEILDHLIKLASEKQVLS